MTFSKQGFKRNTLAALTMLVSTPLLAEKPEEELIVTVTVKPTSRIETSTSVSVTSGADIEKFPTRSLAALYRSIPGIRSETAGGPGNSDMTIRGIPLATGGSKYVQLQEDGLPVLQFGDIIGANLANFLRADYTLDRIESVRGGSASTLASAAPGGILNHISKTGEKEGGAIGFEFGADYDEWRTNFDYGGSINDSMVFHMGGFIHNGEGIRNTGFKASQGGQFKFSLTQELDEGYIRLRLKDLEDSVPVYLPQAVVVDGGGSFSPAPGFDFSKDSISSPYRSSQNYFDAVGNPVVADESEGIDVSEQSIGLEVSLSFEDGWSLENRFKSAKVSSGFIGPIMTGASGGIDTAAVIGAGICNCTNPFVFYANGPQGPIPIKDENNNPVLDQFDNPDFIRTEYSGLATNQLILEFDSKNLDFLVNDFRLVKEFNEVITLAGGVYAARQNIGQQWKAWPRYLAELSGNNAASLDIMDADTGVMATYNGTISHANAARVVDLEYNFFSPYLDLSVDFDRVSFNLGLRHDSVDVNGVVAAGNTRPTDLNGDGDTTDAFDQTNVVDLGGGSAVIHNYDTSEISYSAGVNFGLGEDQAIFARISSGSVPVADRLFGVNGAVAQANAGADDGVDTVEQREIGYKISSENFDFFATVFDTDTQETQSEITTGRTFSREYEAQGIELEGVVELGDFRFNGNVTWTDAEIVADNNSQALLNDDDPSNDDQSVIGNTPTRQADYIFTLTPEYVTDKFSIGASFVGSADAYLNDNNDEDISQRNHIVTHLFASVNLSDSLVLSLDVNNVTDEFILSQLQEAQPSGFATVNGVRYASGGGLDGRSTKISFKYTFQ